MDKQCILTRSHLTGWFRIFAPEFGEVAGTYKWYFVILWMQVEESSRETQTLLAVVEFELLHKQVVGMLKLVPSHTQKWMKIR